uniref:Uncharacterized protein n=1 Tax=Setaria italica TaxID=4555 RepID=K3XNU7_SETIT
MRDARYPVLRMRDESQTSARRRKDFFHSERGGKMQQRSSFRFFGVRRWRPSRETGAMELDFGLVDEQEGRLLCRSRELSPRP